MFVLWANRDVYCATSYLARSGKVRLDGPLDVQPPAEDYSQEACNIAVLGNRQDPPVLAFATLDGLCTISKGGVGVSSVHSRPHGCGQISVTGS